MWLWCKSIEDFLTASIWFTELTRHVCFATARPYNRYPKTWSKCDIQSEVLSIFRHTDLVFFYHCRKMIVFKFKKKKKTVSALFLWNIFVFLYLPYHSAIMASNGFSQAITHIHLIVRIMLYFQHKFLVACYLGSQKLPLLSSTMTHTNNWNMAGGVVLLECLSGSSLHCTHASVYLVTCFKTIQHSNIPRTFISVSKMVDLCL